MQSETQRPPEVEKPDNEKNSNGKVAIIVALIGLISTIIIYIIAPLIHDHFASVPADTPTPVITQSFPIVTTTADTNTPGISPSPNDPLQTYEKNINALSNLPSSKPNADHSPVPVRVQAVSLTQQVLSQLDGNQKGQLMQFLYNAGLITYTHHDLPNWPPDVDIDMSHMDLSGANLAGMNLSGTQINYINLSHANLQGTILNSADLYGANFAGANLTNADLTNATLTASNITQEQEKQVKSLKGALLP